MKYLILVAVVMACVTAETANEKFLRCCKTFVGKDDEECLLKHCSFTAISQTNILNFLSKCTKRGPVVGHMFSCASSNHDHTKCCEAKGVTGKCLEYCSAHDGVPSNYLDYLFCLENFNEIRDCFIEHLDKNEPIFS